MTKENMGALGKFEVENFRKWVIDEKFAMVKLITSASTLPPIFYDVLKLFSQLCSKNFWILNFMWEYFIFLSGGWD